MGARRLRRFIARWVKQAMRFQTACCFGTVNRCKRRAPAYWERLSANTKNMTTTSHIADGERPAGADTPARADQPIGVSLVDDDAEFREEMGSLLRCRKAIVLLGCHDS